MLQITVNVNNFGSHTTVVVVGEQTAQIRVYEQSETSLQDNPEQLKYKYEPKVMCLNIFFFIESNIKTD